MTAPTPGAVLDADGWIEWHGGENPVGDALVEIRLRNGCTTTETASGFPWDHDETTPYADIIAYRLARPAPEPDAFAEYDACLSASDTPPAQPEPDQEVALIARARSWSCDPYDKAIINELVAALVRRGAGQ